MPETVNIQDEFLKRAKNEKIPVVVFLTNKVQLHGVLVGFDRFVVLLDATGKQQMVYKHAITTITPSVAITNLKIFRASQKDSED